MMVSADMITSADEKRIPPTVPRGNYLPFLDGMRGVAALWVVLGHTLGKVAHSLPGGARSLDGPFSFLLGWIAHPGDAVGVFIVLSGFCLALPVMRTDGFTLRGGLNEYFQRRAWRILPGYYAVYFLALAIIVVNHYLKSRMGIIDTSDSWIRNFSVGNIVSHLFLVHNVSPVWAEGGLTVLWSVAVEWQCYFLLPLVLLPLWRYWFPRSANAAIFAVAGIPLLIGVGMTLLPESINGMWSRPWMYGLFGVGVVSAAIATSTNTVLSKWRQLPWGFIGTVLLATVVISRLMFALDVRVGELLMGGAFLSLLLCCVGDHFTGDPQQPVKRATFLVRLFEAKPVAFLGMFSYSLYLTHTIWIPRVATFLDARPMDNATRIFVFWVVILSVSLVMAYLSYLIIEKPFMKIRKSKGAMTASTVENGIQPTY